MLLACADSQSKLTVWAMQGSIINDWQLIRVIDSVDASFHVIDVQPVLCLAWTNIGQNYSRKTWNVKNDDYHQCWTSKFSKQGPSTLDRAKKLDPSIITVTSRGYISLITPGKKKMSAFLPITNIQCSNIVVPFSNYVNVLTVDFQNVLRLYDVEVRRDRRRYPSLRAYFKYGVCVDALLSEWRANTVYV